MKLYKHINVTPSNIHEALSEALGFIRSSLDAMSLSTREANRAQLMAEESLIKLVKHGDFNGRKAISISIRKFLGRITIRLSVPGKAFDFAKSLGFDASFDDEDSDSEIQNILLRSFEDKLKYRHRNGNNRIWITAAESAFTSLY